MNDKRKRKEAILLIEKQIEAEETMLKQMRNYISSYETRYVTIRRKHLEKISVLEYILSKL